MISCLARTVLALAVLALTACATPASRTIAETLPETACTNLLQEHAASLGDDSVTVQAIIETIDSRYLGDWPYRGNCESQLALMDKIVLTISENQNRSIGDVFHEFELNATSLYTSWEEYQEPADRPAENEERSTAFKLEDGVQVFRLSEINSSSTRLLRVWLDGAPQRPSGIVLDLRRCTGGVLHEVLRVVNTFTSDDVLAETHTIDDIEVHRGRSYPDIVKRSLRGVPIAVLIGSETAVGCELIAARIQQEGHRLLGSSTVGVASVHTFIPLYWRDGQGPSAHGILVLTTGQLALPGGRSWQDAPLQPDLLIRETSDGSSGSADPVMEAALAHLRDLVVER